MRHFIITILLLAMAASAMAQDFMQPVARTRENPQVHSKDVLENMASDPEIIESALETPYVKAEMKVFDFADFLSQAQRDSMRNRCEAFVDKCKCDMAIAIVDKQLWTDIDLECFAMDFYDYNDFGVGSDYTGILLVINMGTHRWSIIDNGRASELGVAVENGEALEDAMRPRFRSSDYLGGIIAFINAAESLMIPQKVETTGYPFSLPQARSRENLLIGEPEILNKVRQSDSLTEAALQVPAIRNDYYFYDFTKTVDEYNTQKIQQRCREFCQKYNWELTISLVNMKNWSKKDIESFQDNLYSYNGFGMKSLKGGLYYTYNISNGNSGYTAILNSGDSIETYANQFSILIDKFGKDEFATHFVDMLEALISGGIMTKDGVELSDIVNAASHSKNRLFDISGTLLNADRDTIESMLASVAQSSGRNMHAAVIYAANCSQTRMRQLGNEILDKRNGSAMSMLIFNQYDQSYTIIEDDGAREISSGSREDMEDKIPAYCDWLSGNQIADFISRYHYHSMTIGERIKCYTMYPMATGCCSFPLALVVSITLCLIFKSREYGAKGAGARLYMVKGSYRLIKNNTAKGQTTESRQYSPPVSHSSGGGSRSGYRSGSSGRSHGTRSGGW